MATENRVHIYRRPCCAVWSRGPDANRSAGLHSFSVVALWRDSGLAEFTRRRSDLWMHMSCTRPREDRRSLVAHVQPATAGTAMAEPWGLTET